MSKVQRRESKIIESPENLRRFLLDSIVAVAEGRMNVAQAHAVSNLSDQVHTSIRMQWEMHCYATQNPLLEHEEKSSRNGTTLDGQSERID